MIRAASLTALLLGLAGPVLAQEVEDVASAEDVAEIAKALAMFNCEVPEVVEKETDDLFELDDTVCQAGQYDIKLDGDFVVISMTYDGPVDD